MKIKIQTLTGDSIEVEVDPDSSIADVKVWVKSTLRNKLTNPEI